MAKKPDAAATTAPALPWDTTAPVRLRMLRAREALRSHKLWTKFTGDTRDYEAFSIHALAAACEEELSKVGVDAQFTVEKWSLNGYFRLVEGWLIFTCVERTGEEYSISDECKVYTVGEGFDQSDKGFGKAISYARKSGLIQALNLAIGIDNESSRDKVPEEDARAHQASGQAPDAVSAAAANGPAFTLRTANGSEATFPAMLFAEKVRLYLQRLTSSTDVENFAAANQETLSAFNHYSKAQGYTLHLIIQQRIKELQEAAVAAAASQGVQP